jgi:hypothetical protein
VPLLSGATKIYLGGTPVNKVYVGATQVWAPAGPSADPATEAWVAAVVAAGGTVSAGRKTLIDNLIVGLKADGIWTKLDRLWVFAAENTKSALIDLIALAQATETSAPTFAVDVGYTVDGTKIVDFNYNPGVGTWHFTQDNAHYGAWNLMSDTLNYPLITDNPITSRMLYHKYPNNQLYTRLQDAWNGLAIGDPRGWLVGNRSNSDGRDSYQNGSLFGNVFTGGSSAVNNAPTILYVGGPCSAASFGGSLTATEHLAFYNRLRTYMTAVGVP